MERYLNGDEISEEEIEKCLREGIWSMKITPVICGSASKNIGVPMLLDTVGKYFPPPTYKPEAEGIDPRTGADNEESGFSRPAFQRLCIQDYYRSLCRQADPLQGLFGRSPSGYDRPQHHDRREGKNRADILPRRQETEIGGFRFRGRHRGCGEIEKHGYGGHPVRREGPHKIPGRRERSSPHILFLAAQGKRRRGQAQYLPLPA